MVEPKNEGISESHAPEPEPSPSPPPALSPPLEAPSPDQTKTILPFIDRVNIGNARLLGLSADLNLSGLRFNIALTCLLVTYCAVELPSNILCKLIGGHRYIPFLVFCFGIVTMCTAFVVNRQGLYACRVILGVFEGGISPGIVFLLSLFYRRHELGFRTSIYISASSASGAFGGLLAIGLAKIPAWGVLHSWENIFCFEGLVSIFLGILAFFIIPSGPGTAKFLTKAQRVIAAERILIDAAGTSEYKRTRLKHVVQGLTNLPIVASAAGTCAQSFSLFSPSIIQAMGYTDELAQLLSVGPYVVACLLSLLTGYPSDKHHSRGLLILLTAPLGITGQALLLFLPSSMPSAKYGALYLAAPGIYSFLPLYIAWAVNNAATPTVKAVASGLVFCVGSIGGVLAPWVYLPADAPGYRTGHAILFSFLVVSWAIAAVLMGWIRRENKIRERGGRDHVLQGLGEQERAELSSRHPAFRYVV